MAQLHFTLASDFFVGLFSETKDEAFGNLLAGFLIGVLPAASGGAILMPWVVGIVSEKAGLAAGMASNIVPCVGLVLFTLLVARLPEE